MNRRLALTALTVAGIIRGPSTPTAEALPRRHIQNSVTRDETREFFRMLFHDGHMPQLERADQFNRLVRDSLLAGQSTSQQQRRDPSKPETN